MFLSLSHKSINLKKQRNTIPLKTHGCNESLTSVTPGLGPESALSAMCLPSCQRGLQHLIYLVSLVCSPRHSGPNTKRCASLCHCPQAPPATRGILGEHECRGEKGKQPFPETAQGINLEIIQQRSVCAEIHI